MRDFILTRIKLQITLSYLATENRCKSLKHFFRVSKAEISKLVPEACDAIYSGLEDYIKVRNKI